MGRLEGSGSCYLAGLFHLGIDPGHHAQGCNVRQSIEHLSDALSFHLESLEAPISRGDGIFNPPSDCIWPYQHQSIKCSLCVPLHLLSLKILIELQFEVVLKQFELVLEQEGDKLTR